MPERRLNRSQTAARLRELGIENSRGPAFAYAEDLRDVAYDFHVHRRHQLLYATRGAARLETKDALFLLPPQRAAWIPAGVRHATRANGAEIVSLYFDRRLAPALREVRVFDVPVLLREMIVYSRRWPQSPKGHGPAAVTYFRALLGVATELMQHRPAYELPRPGSEMTARAVDWLLAHVATADLAGAARHARTSPRTLRRRLESELGLHFRALLTQARIQRAIELLARSSRSVLEVAVEVGFQSQSAFTQAFRRSTGQTPRGFRRALLGA
jgi:AraC-like DNA-binding protein/mannose-6-phosphate isomerase-like protein (cupin superfamily)